MINYPYFFLGFSFNVNEIDPTSFEENLSKLKLFRRFTYEEAIAPVGEDVVQSILVLCGTPKPVNPGEPLSTCEYTPILLKDFIASGCRVIPEANLYDTNNLKVYINGCVAVDGEDFAIDNYHNVIKILWDSIKDTDVFSFSISLKQRGGNSGN
jgi:hypothetical protein